jgi:uncharacterized delta-60 repeat protein
MTLNTADLMVTRADGAGYVTTSLTNSNDAAYSTLIQPDGKIIAVGGTTSITKSGQVSFGVGLVRYNTDGSLDTSFGNAGKATIGPGVGTNFIHAALYPTEGTANDGKIVVGGLSSGFAIARFNANGTLDTSFGSHGIATAPFAATNNYDVFLEVIQPDGKIVALGQTADITQGELARFNPDGSLDTTFGQGGMVTGPVADPWSLLLQPDGKLVMVGVTYGATELELARYDPDGTLDTSFGSSGIVTNSSFSAAYAGAIYPVAGTANDGKIVVDGQGSGLELARYNPDGSLDSSFGRGGMITAPTGQIGAYYDNTEGVVIQSDGRIVVSGTGEPHPTYFATARYNTDGSLDSTFGSGGIVTTAISSAEEGHAVALQSNGAIVVAGSSYSGAHHDVFTVVRYLGGPTSGPAFGVTGFPSDMAAGVAQTITVTAEDASGNPNPGYTGTVHFSSSDLQAGLPADYTFTAADQGVHTFTVTLKTAGFQSVSVTDVATGHAGGDDAVTVDPAADAQFVFSAPSSVTHGVAFGVTLTVADAYGNVATGYVGTVHFSSSDGTASLPANYTLTAADAGVHTFSGLVFQKRHSTQTLTVTDTLSSSLTVTDIITVI